jgi:hypothetical protein
MFKSGNVMAGNAISLLIAIFNIVIRHFHLIHEEGIYSKVILRISFQYVQELEKCCQVHITLW